MQRLPEALDAPVRLRRAGGNVADAEVLQDAPEVGRVLGAAELFGERPVRIVADEDAQAIAIEGQGQAVLRAEVGEQGGVAVQVLRGAKVQRRRRRTELRLSARPSISRSFSVA